MATVLQSILSTFKKLLPGGSGTPAVPDSGDPIGDSNIGPIFLLLDEEHNLQDGQILIGASAVAAISNPASAPTISATTGGSLVVGDYQVGVTYKNVYGETQSSPLASITLTSGQTAIHIDALTLPAGVSGVNRYVSDAAGSITLRKQSSASTGAAYNITALPGGTADTPPGSNTTASSNHVEKGTPGAGTGLSLIVRPGSFVYAYDPSGPVDQNGFPFENILIEKMAEVDFPTPSSGMIGRLLYGTSTGDLYFCDGSDWVGTSGGGSSADASTTVKGIAKLSTAPASPTDPIVVGDNDSRMTDARTPVGTALTSGKVWVGNGSNVAAAQTVSGDATMSNAGALMLASTAVTPGSYTNTNLTVDAKGRITAAANGSGGSVPDADATTKGIVKLANDLGGTAALPVVTRVNGKAFASTAPSAGDVPTWNNTTSQYEPAAPAGGSGGTDATSIQGNNVSSAPPSNGDTQIWNSGTSQYEPGPAGSVAFAGASVYRTSDQTISDSTETLINFDNEWFDSDSFHDNSTNNTRMTVPSDKAGKYVVSASIGFHENSTGIRVAHIVKNGSTRIGASAVANASSGAVTLVNVSSIVNLAVGDYIEVVAFQNSGGSLEVEYNVSYTPTFSMGLLGS